MISELSGLVVRPAIVPDSRTVRIVLERGEAHAGWLDPLDYVVASEHLGVGVAAVSVRFGSSRYQGQVVVRSDSGIGELPQLRGKVMCLAPPGSIPGHIAPRLLLLSHGIDPDRDLRAIHEVGDHRHVILAVYHGECDAGAAFHDARATIEEEFPDVWERVAVIATTVEMPRDSLGFAESVPFELRERIIGALFAMAESEEGRGALAEAHGIEGIEPLDDAAFNPLRELLAAAGVWADELDR